MLLNLLVIAPFVAAILMVLNSRDDSNSSSRMAILMAAVFTAMSVALIVTGNQATTPIEWFHIPGTRGPVYYYLYAHGLGTWMVFLSCGLSLVALISARSTTGKSYRNFAIGIFALMGGAVLLLLRSHGDSRCNLDCGLWWRETDYGGHDVRHLYSGGLCSHDGGSLVPADHCRQFPVAFHGGGYSEPPCGT